MNAKTSRLNFSEKEDVYIISKYLPTNNYKGEYNDNEIK